MEETTVKISKTRRWFFEKRNKIYESLARLIKEKGRRIKSIKLEMKMEKSQHTTKTYRRPYETNMSNYMLIKWTTWKKWANLQKYNLPKLNQKEMENLNRPITSMETKVLIKNLPAKEVRDQMASQVSSYSSILEK